MEALWAAGAKVRAYDPVAMPECLRIYGKRAGFRADARPARRPCKAPMRWPSSPSGRNFAARTSTTSRARSKRPSSSTAATSMTPRTWCARASAIMQSAEASASCKAHGQIVTTVDTGNLVRRRGHAALAAVARNVSEAAAGAHRRAHHAAGNGASPGGHRGSALSRSSSATRRIASRSPSSCARSAIHAVRHSARARGPQYRAGGRAGRALKAMADRSGGHAHRRAGRSRDSRCAQVSAGGRGRRRPRRTTASW